MFWGAVDSNVYYVIARAAKPAPATVGGVLINLGSVALALAITAASVGFAAPSQAENSTSMNATPLISVASRSTVTPRFVPRKPAAPIDCSKVACVALTFDDGPSMQTDDLLAALASRNVKATFFVLGVMIQRHPDAIAKIAQAGHVIGTHGFSHHSFATMTPDAITQEIQQTNDLIVAGGGVTPTLLRPPFGSGSRALTQAEQDFGLVDVRWNVDPEDWRNPGAPAIVQRVVDAAKPGSIILMHDIYPGTSEAVPAIVDALRAKGMTLVTVPQLIGSQPPGTQVLHGPGV